MVALSARLPASLVLGLLLAIRRPRRAILTTLSLLITDVMIVCALALHSSFASGKSTDVMVNQPGLGDPLLAQVDSVVLVVTVILVVLATINTIFITQATVLDAQRPSALARAFGATPYQVSAGLTAAQLIPALLGGILSVPAGISLYRVAARVAGGAPNANLPGLLDGRRDRRHSRRCRRADPLPSPSRGTTPCRRCSAIRLRGKPWNR